MIVHHNTSFNNSSSCYAKVQVNMNMKVLSQLIALITLNICIIFGNGLVILAVIVTKKLRTLTSYLITSLAVADLMIGITVLPFSTINQILDNRWLFDEVWCQIWLAIDVWMCTASIYNLTAIGIDRFVAIVKPLLYPSIITPKRGKMLICAVWISSFVICFPPMIVQWPQIFSSAANSQEDLCICTPMQNSPGYIVFSALGSFHLPMIVIISLYVRIYWTVRLSAKSLLSGYIIMNRNGNNGSTQLRINKRNDKQSTTVDVNSQQTMKKEQPQTEQKPHRNSEPTVNVSPKTVQQRKALMHHRTSLLHIRPFVKQERPPNLTTQRLLRRVNKECFTVASFAVDENARNSLSSVDDEKCSPPQGSPSRGSWSDIFANNNQSKSASSSASIYLRKCQTNFNNYQKKMRMEIRAAKTVAIVTGCFIFCWLGFSVIYLLKAFPWCQNDCIPDVVFNICFWLGYANSALNPFIYAVFNKEFRRAFRSLLSCNQVKSLRGTPTAVAFRKLQKH